MKVFLDTNVFLEYFQQRVQYQSVEKIFKAIEDKKMNAVVSAGCIYTLAYIIRMEFKRMGVYRPEQTTQLRSTLDTVLELVTVGNLSHKNIQVAVDDVEFDDIEDSFQYQCAMQNKCDIFITVNTRDFRGVTSPGLTILTPEDFSSQFL